MRNYRCSEDRAVRLAAELANNHAKFQSFGWSSDERPEDCENWAIVYLSSRDSGLLAKSNESVILSELAPYIHDVVIISHSHWAVGYVDGILIRVYNTDGTITDAFRKYAGLKIALDDYPVLNEDDYSNREYAAAVENIEQVGKRMVRDDAPETWPGDCFSWFWDNNQSAVENRDDQGGYPTDDDMTECLTALGYMKDEE